MTRNDSFVAALTSVIFATIIVLATIHTYV